MYKEKKYRLEVTEMSRKTEEQIKAERERKNEYGYPQKFNDTTPYEYDWNTLRTIQIELTEEQMNAVKKAAIEAI